MRHLSTILIVLLLASCATTKVVERECPPCEAKPEPKKEKKIVIKDPLVIKPKSPEQLEKESLEFFSLANSYFDAEKYDEAAKLYTFIMNDNPDFREKGFINYNLALIHFKKERFDRAADHAKKAIADLQKPMDRKDALLLHLESNRHTANWNSIVSDSEEAVDRGNYFSLTEDNVNELFLRRAEALVMQGKVDEGRKSVQATMFKIRRGKTRTDLLYNNEYAMANFVLGRSHVYEFKSFQLENNEKSLAKKCTYILDAQTKFIQAIKVGIIYWSNASAFEIADLYKALYEEMENYKIPDDLEGEERDVYRCELWNRISVLLKKARRTLKKSLEAAKRINEINEYTEKSFKMISEIEKIYNMKEQTCKKGGLQPGL